MPDSIRTAAENNSLPSNGQPLTITQQIISPQPSQFIPFSVPTTKMPMEQATVSATETLSLGQSLDKSLAESPRMSGVRATLGIAKSAYAAATALPNPGIYTSNVFHNNYLIGASIPFEPPWKLAFRLLVAKRQVDQVRLEILKSMWLFRGQVRTAYVQLVIAEELVKSRLELRDLAQRIVDSTQVQFDNGNVPGLDIRRARLAQIQAKMDYKQAQIQIYQNREQLNLIMGADASAPLAVQKLPDVHDKNLTSELLPNFNRQYPTRERLVQMAMESRLELKIAKQAIAVNKANRLNTIGNILPTPRFVVGKALELNPPNPPGPSQHVAFFQGYIDAPLFNFQQGDLAKFKATGIQLELDLKAQENIIAGQVSLAYHKMLAARERIHDFIVEALPESEAVNVISKRGYDIGQIDLNTLLDAQRSNIQMKTQFCDAVLNYQLALNELEQAVGTTLDY